MPATLIILSGLPGTGKTTLAKCVARKLGALHLRIDTIEQAIRRSSIAPRCMEDAGYLVGYGLAADNLRLNHIVIADCVNPWPLTRDAWRQVARDAGASHLNVEVICSDTDLHRRRIENRQADIEGLKLPSWADVLARDYRPWSENRLILDTASQSAAQASERLMAELAPL